MSGIIRGFHTGHVFSQYEEVTVGNTTTEDSLLGAGKGSVTLESGFFNERGAMIRMTVMGTWKKSAISALTLRINVVKAGVVTELHKKIFSSDRLGADKTGHWTIMMDASCYSTGPTGTILMHGMLQLLENDSAEILGLHSETGLFTLDTTTPTVIQVTAQWGTQRATSSNNIKCAIAMLLKE